MGGLTCASNLAANWLAISYPILCFTPCCRVSRIDHAIFTECGRGRGRGVMFSTKKGAIYNDLYSLPSSHLLLFRSYARNRTCATKILQIRIIGCGYTPFNVVHASLTSPLSPLRSSADDQCLLNLGSFDFSNLGQTWAAYCEHPVAPS